MTVAPITRTIRGPSTEISVGAANGLDHESVVSCDNLLTIPVAILGPHIGDLLPGQELERGEAIRTAFDLA